MVRMADFFKRQAPEESPAEAKKGSKQDYVPPNALPSKIPIKEIQKENPLQVKPVESISLKDASDAMLKKIKVESTEGTDKLYQDSLALIKVILEEGSKNEPIEIQRIKEQIDKLVDQLTLGNSELLNLTINFTSENYLYGHSVNVCILSITIGIGLGYSRAQLVELGVASFLHDIGMVKVTDISKKPGKLTQEEYDQVKHHPVFGMDMLEMVKDISKAAIYVAQEHHEWANGQGYPQGLKGEQIDEYARIVATVDTYEALTHPRTYREKMQPYEAIRDILKNKEHFDFKFLKVLIEKIGIFPVGSWVQLSTNEIGVVVDIHKDSPLKPTVKVILDSHERRLSEERIIDLTQYPAIYIKKPVDSVELLVK